MGIVNRIGEPEQERLGLFTEEAGEVQLEIGKILRHGIDSHHPDEPGLSNAQRLEMEAGHVLAAIDLLVSCGTLSGEGLERSRRAKLQKLRSWLHCGTNLDAVEELLRQKAPDGLMIRVAGFLSLVARGLVPIAKEHQLEAEVMLDEIGARLVGEVEERNVSPGTVRVYGISREEARAANEKEAEAHAAGGCDAPNIGVAEDGTQYCSHCGWNDPKGAQA